MSSATLFRLSGLALLLVAPIGVLGHVILHPPGHQLEHMNSPMWVPAHSLILISFLLILFGLAGLYACQSHRAGELGLVGFVLAVLSLTVSVTTMVFEVFVVPVLAANPSTSSSPCPKGRCWAGRWARSDSWAPRRSSWPFFCLVSRQSARASFHARAVCSSSPSPRWYWF